MRKLITYFIFSLLSLSAFCQQKPLASHSKNTSVARSQKSNYIAYNSWINFTSGGPLSDQQYYKIPITKEGIYHITYSNLLAANINVGSIPANKYQLFYKGVEQPIFVSNNSTSPLTAGGYIEFYGQGNDGQLDSNLYVDDYTSVPDGNAQPNIRYSLFTDTAIYFLTWLPNSIVNTGLRFTIQNDTSFSAHTPVNYFQREIFQEYITDYNVGSYLDSDNDLEPDYTSGEGFCSPMFSKGYNNSFTFNVPNKYSGGPNGSLSTAMAGRSGSPTNFTCCQRTTVQFNSSLLKDDTFPSYYFNRWNFNIPNSIIGTSNTVITSSVDAGNDNAQYQSVYYYDFIYPHTLDFSNENFPKTYKFVLPDDSFNSEALLKLTTFTNNPLSNYILFDVTNGRRVSLVNNSNTLYGLVSNGGNKTCYITLTDSIMGISGITPVNDTNNSRFINFNYYGAFQKTDSAYIIITHKSLWSQANAYASYRAPLHSVVVDVDELYNQFAWGIQKHPLAIRNFIAYTFANWSNHPPQYLFLLGKAVYSAITRNNNPNVVDNSANYAKNLVPAFGFPTSDNLFTSRILNNSVFDPALPTGRLAAQSNADVQTYLTKVKLYETAPIGEWEKQVLHFGGGTDNQLDQEILNYFSIYAGIIEAPWFGGNVTAYTLTSNNVISINQSDSLQNQINSGVSIMTFFSHAAGPVGFQISTAPPSTYQNKPNFPLVIANSCLVGDIDEPSVGFDEQFVIDINNYGQVAGAIAFLGPSTAAYPDNLFDYTTELYSEIATTNYGNSIGRCIKATIDSDSNNLNYREICLEMTLHGDPAVVIASPKLPDLVMNTQNVIFSPYPVTSEMNTFQMTVICVNQGRAIAPTDSFYILVRRTYPTGIVKDTNILVHGCNYRDTITISLPVDQFNGLGLNTFYVNLDNTNLIHELNETNNSTTVTLFIQSPDIAPVFPTNYAIVPHKDSLVLKACTSNPFAPSATYDFQIDTTDAYNSPMLRTTRITQSGGVVNWANPYPFLKDSTVYFWRVSPHATVDSLFKWKEFSFIYIPNKTGWSQAHFFQFKYDSDTDVVYNKPMRKWDFVTNVASLQVYDQLYPPSGQPAYTVNNEGGDYQGCDAGLYLVVIDSLTLAPWYNDKHNLGCENYPVGGGRCGRSRPQAWFIYNNSPSYMNALAQTLNDSIPCGDFILLISVDSVPFQSLPINLKAAIYNLGDHHVTQMLNGQPYIFFTQKCHNNLTQVSYKNAHDNTPFVLNYSLNGEWTNGTINSTVIGPASKWSSLHWKEHPIEAPYISKDYVYLRLMGFNSVTGNTDTLIRDLPVNITDTNLASISATTYPFLELQAYLQDTALRTPPQMNKWQIYYDGVPDVALNPSKGFSFYKNPLTGGDTLKFMTCIENISNYNMPDSLHVSFYVYDQNRVRHNLQSQTKKKMNVGDTVMASVVYDSTQNFAGLNSFWIEANPLNSPIEQYHFNNLGEIDFKVSKDVINPILDVTFDGVHILNNDIVSAKPDIVIKLTDENKYLALNDTSLFQVTMISPSGTISKLWFESNSPVPLDRTRMGWTPAQMPNNSFKIVYEPILQDGIYTLDVQAIDRSHNYSGANDYKISFEVINHESITEILNYPNPFSTSTRFVFTLTGSQLPTYFKIQIMTVTGHVIREIMQDELGPIHIGRNITQYAWNGKDQYGDQLANGVYFYRIVTRLNGQMIDQLASGADQWISHGIGKMYLMR